ncbi:coiled-coil domain-containing protein 85C-like protein [Leptotrombidium deliense]|uniref:Coiled-coil domain-containing protein 85C-like protein n=1 Tax=Leptotrombidium deliense TaxID=299467 RepID=A0A443SB16_9ACAR|nr:coiled-coil domain-containing protein 85C-like protein [Leptotrombidium deliense]
MSSSSLSNVGGMPPAASPPLQNAPPPPSVSATHLHLHNPHNVQRSHVRSPTATITTPPPPTPDDELLGQLSREELISRIRSLEARNRKLLYDNGAMMKDINHHLTTIQSLKRSNYQLMTDNTELRDMCCYLDDERSRARTISREWQSFGTHMSRVMRHEVKSYSSKLSQLETKQFELVRENFELKQLCLLLDNAIATRENPDGSTGSSNTEDSSRNIHATNSTTNTNVRNSQQQHRVVLSQQILEYIRSLEAKVQQLEWEKKQLCDLHSNPDTMDSYENNSITHSENNQTSPRDCPPAAVTEAMRVLRIQESMNSSCGSGSDAIQTTNNSNTEHHENGDETEMDNVTLEQQRAIVRSLCNVAWRKIEDGT